MDTVNLVLDGESVKAVEGTSLLEVIQKRGIAIPALCTIEGFGPFNSCMLCLVELQNTGRLVPACSTRVCEGDVVSTGSARVKRARRTALELLISEHEGDCESPCRRGCPAHMDIPRMIRALKADDLTEALKTIRQHIALPGVLGWICPAPCEKVCRRGGVDAPLAICLLKRFAVDANTNADVLPVPDRAEPRKKRVAVVGAGPAGLSVAYYLLREGFNCEIIDEQKEPGGTLRYCISEDTLPRRVLDRDIEVIRTLGAEFKMATRIDLDETSELLHEVNAVVIATGAGAVVDETGRDFSKRISKRASERIPERIPEQIPERVCVCGDASRTHGSRLAVKACAHGRSTALYIARKLSNQTSVPPWQSVVKGVPDRRFDSYMPRMSPDQLRMYVEARNPLQLETTPTGSPTRGVQARGSPTRGSPTRGNPTRGSPARGALTPARPLSPGDGLDPCSAKIESCRCLDCDCGDKYHCQLRKYADEYGATRAVFSGIETRGPRYFRTARGITYEPGKCIKCGNCVRITERAGERLGLGFEGKSYNLEVKVPFDEALDHALAAAGAECVDACPTGALQDGERYESSV